VNLLLFLVKPQAVEDVDDRVHEDVDKAEAEAAVSWRCRSDPEVRFEMNMFQGPVATGN